MLTLATCALTVVLWVLYEQVTRPRLSVAYRSPAGKITPTMFSTRYPENAKFKNELEFMRITRKLSSDNEILINKMVYQASVELGIPPSVLWCLLFQESRFNHLLGLDADGRARGLGQFSYYSFYEINHDLGRYTQSNLSLFRNLLGTDIRFISAPEKDITQPSSYFFIPTAVTATAAYLNNRYHQLKRNAERRNLRYDPDLMWLISAMAYNKGTRSVLTLWNETQDRGGKQSLENLLSDPQAFFDTTANTKHLTKVFSRIWPLEKSARYAKELSIHMTQMKDCSLSSELIESIGAKLEP